MCEDIHITMAVTCYKHLLMLSHWSMRRANITALKWFHRRLTFFLQLVRPPQDASGCSKDVTTHLSITVMTPIESYSYTRLNNHLIRRCHRTHKVGAMKP